jgi:crotonobetainyl-CoA:carnitine CoA-transferase CaiB-like acyl-CoA transferase
MTQPRGNRDPVFAPQGCYPAAGEDAWVAVSVQSDDQWQTLCRLIQRDDLGADAALATAAGRHAQHDLIDEAIAAWTRRRSGPETAQLLQAADVPAAPTMNPADVPGDQHLQARKLFGAIPCLNGGERLAPRVPWLIDGIRPAQAGRPPHVGEHTEHVLRDVLGLGDAELARLAEERIIW